MWILGRLCSLVVFVSVLQLYKRDLRVLLWLFLMGCSSCLKYFTQGIDFRNGLLVLGFLSPALNVLGLFLLFVVGLRSLQFSWHGLVQFLCDVRAKSRHPRNMFCPKSDIGESFDSKVTFCKCGPLKSLENSKLRHKDNPLLDKEDVNPDGDVPADDYEREFCIEDEEFDVIALRRLVKVERLRADMVSTELEKERMAAASAVDEAMRLILRLQSEMSSMEIEANQYRRFTEQKQEYDEQVIQSLKWIVMKRECEMSILEEKLIMCRQKLKQYMMDDEINQFEGFDGSACLEGSTMKDGVEDILSNQVDVNPSIS
uniref:GTD-binding domain-containing protein n=1 Tax=Rhizophora mucronata TaxID=61149 RepID=A0A2P2JB12_RHIMU